MNVWIFSTLLCLNLSFLDKEVSSEHFFQSIFTNLETREQAVDLDNKIRSIDGIVVSRCDVVSKKFFCVFDTNKISSNQIIDKINSWGFHLNKKCFQEGVKGIDKVIDLLKTCNNDN